MSSVIQARRNLRRRMRENTHFDQYSHLFVTLVLISNMLLIMYALISVTLRMTLSGVGFIDSLPIALYILPLLIFLPLMTRSFYRDRTAAWNFVFLMVCTGFFSLLSLLVRGFVIALVFNIVAAVLLFLMGRFRPKGSLKSAGKKGLVYIILLNMLGLTFPISTVIMGQTPIDGVQVAVPSNYSLEVPLNDFDFAYSNLTPDSSLISDIESLSFGLDFKLSSSNDSSWTRLVPWLTAINDTLINYTVTLSADRASLAGNAPQNLGTNGLISAVYVEHYDAINRLDNLLITSGITKHPETVILDMTLSRVEWQKLMFHTRSLDLIGFSNLMRQSLDSISASNVDQDAHAIRMHGESAGFTMGIMVDSFVLDDVLDSDTLTMLVCGQTLSSLTSWSRVDVLCSRSRFSFEMLGDVGEYMVNSYSRSISALGSHWTMRVGEIGNLTDVDDRVDSVYTTLDQLSRDLALASGHGVGRITIGSLPSLLTAFGNESLNTFRSSIDDYTNASATYTFRIYAFRAVFIAIDAFDFIML